MLAYWDIQTVRLGRKKLLGSNIKIIPLQFLSIYQQMHVFFNRTSGNDAL